MGNLKKGNGRSALISSPVPAWHFKLPFVEEVLFFMVQAPFALFPPPPARQCSDFRLPRSDFRLPTSAPPFLLVLGIAQDAGYPQADCRKDCCRQVWQGQQPRAKTSCLALVDPAAGCFWLIDATPDFREQLQEMEPYGELAGILLTHAHIGHYTGLMHLGREAMGAKGVPVYAMPRMRAFLETNGPWSQLVQLNNIELRPLTADTPLTLSPLHPLPQSPPLQITPLPVPHRDEYSETVGFLIEGPARKALYIPDIDKWHLWDRDIRQLIRQVDIAFLDGTFFENGEIPGRDMSEIPHPFIEESLQLFASLPAEERAKVRFIHFNHTNPVLDAQGEAVRRIREAGCGVAEEGKRFYFGNNN